MSNITKFVERTYKPTQNPMPHYEVERCITTRKYVFDVINPETGEIINQSTLWWKRDTNDTHLKQLYRGCSYRFSDYNPTPVTDWFYGVPLNQMIGWCTSHNLVNMRYVEQYTNITYIDKCVWDEYNMEWVVPKSSRSSRLRAK